MTLTLTQNASLGNEAPLTQTAARFMREKAVRRLITRYEKAVFSFFRELSLPLKFREIVRAFILASDGNTFFEASYNELTDFLFKRSAMRLQANRETVRYHARALQSWQVKKKVELIRVIDKGRKINHPDGSIEYLKSKYQLVLLDELVKVLYNCPSNEINARIKEAVSRMKDNYVPEETKRQLPTRFKLERCVKTVFTKFGRAFEQAEEIKLNPVDYCQRLILDLQSALDEIAAERAEKQRREGYISAFCASINSAQVEIYEDKGVEKHHQEVQGILDGNLPSDNRHFPPSTVIPDVAGGGSLLNSRFDVADNENSLLHSALHYAQAGVPVFPLQNPIFENGSVRCSCREWQDCKKVGKHPRTWHGLKDATTDVETIKGWWQKWPNANVGLLTGKQSGIFVLDVDVKSGGLYSLEDIQDAYGELPPTLTAITGSNGKHLIFSYPDVRLNNSTSLIAPGLDIKSDNGYIVASPSIHASGGRYKWHGVNTRIEDAPEWLIALILLAEEDVKQNDHVKSVSTSDVPTVLVRAEKIKEGQVFNTASGKTSHGRHDYLFRYASGLIMSHSYEQVLARVQAKDLAVCVPPVGYADVVKLVESAERYRPTEFQKAA